MLRYIKPKDDILKLTQWVD